MPSLNGLLRQHEKKVASLKSQLVADGFALDGEVDPNVLANACQVLATRPEYHPYTTLLSILEKSCTGAAAKGVGHAAASRGTESANQAALPDESVTCASQYVAYVELVDASSKQTYHTTAVVCSPRHIATHHHGVHEAMTLDKDVQVHLPATQQVLSARVVLIRHHEDLDCVILEVQGKIRLPAPYLRPGASGEAYFLLGKSGQEHPSTGHLVSCRTNKRGHILGDSLPGRGNSGGGVFSLDGTSLLGMCVGRDTARKMAYIIPSNKLLMLLASLQLSGSELSDLDLDHNPNYDTD